MKIIDAALLNSLTQTAKTSERKRAHFNLHESLSDPVQRLFVAIEPETYIRPHRHADPSTSEVFIMVRGSGMVLFFDDSGRVINRLLLSAAGPVQAVEIPAGTWHTIASLETGSVFFEAKQGPYNQPKGMHAAAWAPEEGRERAGRCRDWFKTASIGDLFSPEQRGS